MATTDFNLEQYIDNKALDEIERETLEGNREEEAKQLHLDLEMPLPTDPEGRKKALSDREEIFDNLRVLNNKLSPQPTPAIVQWEDIPDIERREWLIDQWLPSNTVTMFNGEGGAGKSWLTLQAVCQVCCGFRDAYLNPHFKKFADVSTRRDVVFATYEDEPAEIKRRLQALANGMPWIKDSMDTIKRNLHIVDMRGIGSVWGPGMGKHIQNTGDLLSAGEDLRAICEEKEARLLVLDPLSGAFGGNENDRTAVYDFVSSFRGWGDTAKCAMLVIGHLPKSKEGKEAGFSGSPPHGRHQHGRCGSWKRRSSSRRNQRTMKLWRLRGSTTGHLNTPRATMQLSSHPFTLPSKNRAGSHRLPTQRKQLRLSRITSKA